MDLDIDMDVDVDLVPDEPIAVQAAFDDVSRPLNCASVI
jgi:hypothetical protein